MKALTGTIPIVFGLMLLIMCIAGASEYNFGTKVFPGDSDLGKPLFAMPAGTTIAYWDTGVVPGYDETDVVYITTPPTSNVKANDVRLTPYGTQLAAGSKVTPADNDIGMPLTSFPSGSAICYLNLFGSTYYDWNDPVYFHQTTYSLTLVNDVRLNATPDGRLNPGTKVRDFDSDLSKLLGIKPLVALPLSKGSSSLGFFDFNGNGVYDYYDDVYMNFPAGVPAGVVTVNNERLSGPV